MHSRIFVIAKKEDLDINPEMVENCGITEDDLFEHMNGIADYVDSDLDDPGEDMRMLAKAHPEFQMDFAGARNPENPVLKIDADVKKAYFKDRFEEVKDTVSKMTLEEFSGLKGLGYPVWKLREMLDSHCGYFVAYVEDGGYYEIKSFDLFVREAAFGDYVICGVFDYHC